MNIQNASRNHSCSSAMKFISPRKNFIAELKARCSSRQARIVALFVAFTAVAFYSSTSASSVLFSRSGNNLAPPLALKAIQSAEAAVIAKADLNIARRGHTATALEGGEILFVGGENDSGFIAQSEIFDPALQSLVIAAKLKDSRSGHTATRLADGSVLVAGGRTRNGTTNRTEIFDPARGAFAKGPKMRVARTGHSATLLADGRVLIIGGDADGSVEIFDPASRRFSLTAARLSAPRIFHSAVLFGSGKALVAGGLTLEGRAVLSGEILDLTTMSFSGSRNAMKTSRTHPTLRALPDGKVQVIGGNSENSIEIFDAEGQFFTAYARLLPASNPVSEILCTQTRSAIIHTDVAQSIKEQGEDSVSLSEMLDRGDHSLIDTPESGRALIAGGVDRNGKALKSVVLLRSSKAYVTTAKSEYAPGGTVTIMGKGWNPGEAVSLTVHGELSTREDVRFLAVADATGSIKADFLTLSSRADKAYTVTASGQASTLTAQTAFAATLETAAVDNVDIVKLCELAPGSTEGANCLNIGTHCITGKNGNFPDKPLVICNTACIAVTFEYSVDPGTTTAEVKLVGNGAAQVGSATGTIPDGQDQTACITVCIDQPIGNQNLNVQVEVFNGGKSKSAAGGNLISVEGACATAPQITCPNNFNVNTDTGKCTASVSFNPTATGTPTPTVECKIGSTVITSPHDFPVGTTTVTCTATNSEGSASCSFDVSVSDNAKPTIGSCPSNITQANDAGKCTAVVSYTAPTASDNCGSADVVCSPASGSTFSKGTTTVTCTATDSFGNTQSCSFTVTVNDTEKPTIGSCPSNITQGNDAGKCTAVVSYTAPTASDNCGSADVVCSPASGSTFSKGTTTVTCTATDGSGNTQSCSFTVTVNDTEKPTLNNCPSDQNVSATSCTGTDVSYTAPTASDNCGSASVVCSPPSGSTFPIGTSNVTCTATDTAGNTQTCSFKVNVSGAGPSFTNCPNNIVTSNEAGKCSASVSFNVTATGTPTPTVECKIGNTVITSPHTFPVGVTQVVCTASSDGGCTATCSFSVTVNDTEKPSITCPNNITETAPQGSSTAVANFSPSASDNCGSVSTSCSPPSGSAFPLGTTAVTCTATDSAGNTQTCSFNVTVQGTAPSISCPDNIVTNTCNPVAPFSVSASGNPTPVVECKVGNTVITSPHNFSVGTTTVTCSAVNSQGSASCSFTVTVNDNDADCDGVIDNLDNCPFTPNPDQADSNHNGVGDACEVRFDKCVQDDFNGSVLLWNSTTGDYIFCCGDGFTVRGRGIVENHGGICTIRQANEEADRRLAGKYDTIHNKGAAQLNVSPSSDLPRCVIIDRDTRNNTCICKGDGIQ